MITNGDVVILYITVVWFYFRQFLIIILQSNQQSNQLQIQTQHYLFTMSPSLRPSLRGYSDIMHSDENIVVLDGSGQKVDLPHANPHHLWEQHNRLGTKTPVWHLRVTVLKDQEARGDCPPHIFVSFSPCESRNIHMLIHHQAFPSLEQLARAVNQIEAAFGETFDLKKCGIETPDAMGGRVNDGRSENITIEFDSKVAEGGWKEFLIKLKGLEAEWEHTVVTSTL
jgi:hypothetical protein